MTNQEICDCFSRLVSLSNSTTHFPVKVAFAILSNQRKLDPIVKDIDNLRYGIISKYCDPLPEDNTRFTPRPETKDQFEKEFDELMEIKNDDIKLTKVTLADLGDISLSLQDMESLYPMITEN